MMKLDKNTYRDRVYACFTGKNIGGTMGGPYEQTHDILDIKGFATEPGAPLPNDDLDLQLVWLTAVEKAGPYGLDCKRLGEFWQSYIVPHWNEYGIGKANMRRGLFPPLSGDYENDWKDSNGAWIRTEIWATLAPGLPSVAAKYAIEDAKVDHGCSEGTYSAAFVAAMQSAAFTVHSIREMIEVGLANVPEDCRTAKSVRAVMDCYDKKMPAMEARQYIQQMNADIGNGWFEAPSNVGYTVIGLLYGEGDFEKSMLTAINCGDDTDCTGGTVGATLGLFGGSAIIPEKWKAYIGDAIVTISLNRGIHTRFPGSCTELTDRIVRMAPVVIEANREANLKLGEAGYVTFGEGEEIPENIAELYRKDKKTRRALEALRPYSFSDEFGPVRVTVIYDGAPEIVPGGEKKLTLHFKNVWNLHGFVPYNLDVEWILPEGFTVKGPAALALQNWTAHSPVADVSASYTITAGEKVAAVNELILCVRADSRMRRGLIPVNLIGK